MLAARCAWSTDGSRNVGLAELHDSKSRPVRSAHRPSREFVPDDEFANEKLNLELSRHGGSRPRRPAMARSSAVNSTLLVVATLLALFPSTATVTRVGVTSVPEGDPLAN